MASAGALLYAGDKAFKDELGKVLDLHVWAAGKDLVGGRVRTAEKAAAASAAAADARAKYVTRLRSQADDAEARRAAWDAQHQQVGEELLMGYGSSRWWKWKVDGERIGGQSVTTGELRRVYSPGAACLPV